jgi:hypothetical protein
LHNDFLGLPKTKSKKSREPPNLDCQRSMPPAVAIVLGWPSARGLSISNIADQVGCTTAALTRSIARFNGLAGLGLSAGDARPIGVSNDDKPAAVQA